MAHEERIKHAQESLCVKIACHYVRTALHARNLCVLRTEPRSPCPPLWMARLNFVCFRRAWNTLLNHYCFHLSFFDYSHHHYSLTLIPANSMQLTKTLHAYHIIYCTKAYWWNVHEVEFVLTWFQLIQLSSSPHILVLDLNVSSSATCQGQMLQLHLFVILNSSLFLLEEQHHTMFNLTVIQEYRSSHLSPSLHYTFSYQDGTIVLIIHYTSPQYILWLHTIAVFFTLADLLGEINLSTCSCCLLIFLPQFTTARPYNACNIIFLAYTCINRYFTC